MELLTLTQMNKLHSVPRVEDHLKRNIKLYVSIAARVRVAFPEYHELDRVDLVSLMIKMTDKDVYGLDRKDMSVDEICDIFAREAVGMDAN
jgi:hypothetical protein